MSSVIELAVGSRPHRVGAAPKGGSRSIWRRTPDLRPGLAYAAAARLCFKSYKAVGQLSASRLSALGLVFEHSSLSRLNTPQSVGSTTFS